MTSVRRLTVLGLGYLGSVHAACMATQGMDVLGIDTDAEKVRQLSSGQLPIFEPDLAGLLREGLRTGRLRFTTSYAEAAAFGEVHFICVGTPQRRDGDAADVTQIMDCVTSLAPLLSRPCVIVGKSTVPAGTAAMLSEAIARLAPAGEGVELCWNPEFLREGHAVKDTLNPDRIVVGVASSQTEAVLRDVYSAQIDAGVPFYVTDMATAELAKSGANAFLATKISFINAMAELCEATGADITVLARILGADPRIGDAFLRPGVGFGGGCLPKDIRALQARANELGVGEAVEFLREVDAINLRCRATVVSLATEAAGGTVAHKTVCVLGAAFKPGSDDVRDSPALDIAQILHREGARVKVYDPVAMGNARKACPELVYSASVAEAARDARVVLVLTEWPEFVAMDPVELGTVADPQRSVIDGRHILDAARWRAAGWDYRALGVLGGPDRRPHPASRGLTRGIAAASPVTPAYVGAAPAPAAP
jgi:UDPglucose 6-dehydrogenase